MRYIKYEIASDLAPVINTEGVHAYPNSFTDSKIDDDMDEISMEWAMDNESFAKYELEKDDNVFIDEEYYSSVDYYWYEISEEEYSDYLFNK